MTNCNSKQEDKKDDKCVIVNVFTKCGNGKFDDKRSYERRSCDCDKKDDKKDDAKVVVNIFTECDKDGKVDESLVEVNVFAKCDKNKDCDKRDYNCCDCK